MWEGDCGILLAFPRSDGAGGSICVAFGLIPGVHWCGLRAGIGGYATYGSTFKEMVIYMGKRVMFTVELWDKRRWSQHTDP